jgi:hypothetical protein
MRRGLSFDVLRSACRTSKAVAVQIGPWTSVAPEPSTVPFGFRLQQAPSPARTGLHSERTRWAHVPRASFARSSEASEDLEAVLGSVAEQAGTRRRASRQQRELRVGPMLGTALSAFLGGRADLLGLVCSPVGGWGVRVP